MNAYSQINIKEQLNLTGRTDSLSRRDTTHKGSTGKISKNVLNQNFSNSSQNSIVLPRQSSVTVTIIESEAAASARISLEMRQPGYEMLSEYANYDIGYSWESPEYPAGTTVEFGMDWYWNNWGTIYGGKEAGSVMSKISDDEYVIGFEALGDDWDYNELVISVKISSPLVVSVNLEPNVLTPGDTARINISASRGGEPVLLPVDQTYEIGLSDGCEYGMILTSDGRKGTYFADESLPLYFIVPDDFDADSVIVKLKAGLVNSSSGGGAALTGNKRGSKENGSRQLPPANNSMQELGCAFNFTSENIGEGTATVNKIVFEVDAVTEKDDQTTMTLLSEEVAKGWITETPEMPAFELVAKLKRFNRGNVKFDWNLSIWWTNSLNKNKAGQIEPRTIKTEYNGSTNSINSEFSAPWKIDWRGLIRGGNESKLTIKATVDGKVYTIVHDNIFKILGKNPSIEQVKEGLTLQKQTIIYKETLPKWCQFRSTGLPIFGPPKGYGLMQLDTPDATDEQIWNWKANRAVGLSLFQQKINNAQQYGRKIRQGKYKKGKMHLWYPNEYINAPDLANGEQFWKEAFQRYNGGCFWRWYPDVPRDPNSTGHWDVTPCSGYGQNAWDIYLSVLNNNPPADWN